MKEITKQNYKTLSQYNMEGILVCVPKIDLYANADFYIYGLQINKDNEYEFPMIAYNKEDGCINGFSATILNIDQFELIFKDFDIYRFYLFDNMLDFCTWYVEQDKQQKQMIKETVQEWDTIEQNIKKSLNTENSNLYGTMESDWIPERGKRHVESSVEELPQDKVIPQFKKLTRREKYQDVLKLFMYQYELMELQATLDMAEGYWDKQEAQDTLKQKQKEFENWLDEVIE